VYILDPLQQIRQNQLVMLLIGYRQIHEDKVKNKYLNYYIYVWKRNRTNKTFNK